MTAEVINFSALEQELQSAVEADKKYQRENDAKFRALHQKVGTYEEFRPLRDIVLASHLKPLDRKDKAGAPRKQLWNALASTDKGQNQTSCDEIGLKLSEFQPKTASEFSRDWRRFGSENPEDKYSLLLSLGGEGLQDIFRAEGDEATVIGVLEGLSKTPRFGLNMSFLSRAEREACGELFQNLRKASAAGNSSVRGPEGDVIVHGSYVEEIKEAHDDEAETLCPGPGQTSEAAGGSSDTETLNGIMQLYGTLSFSVLSAYEAPEDKEDIFASRACPAFLVFDNAAYLADMTIELPCHCKPEEAHSVVWYYQKQLGSPDTRALTDFQGTSVVDSSKVGRGGDLRSRFSIRLFRLLIFRAQKEDSGHYLCRTTKGDLFYGYDVDVQEAYRVSFPWSRAQRWGRVAAVAARAASRSNQDLPLYQVFTSFWPWSVCDRCGVQGEQTRVGLCYVKTNYLHVRYRRTSPTVASCGSSAVPQCFGLTQANHQGAELGVRSCQVPCPPRFIPQPEHQALLEFLGYNKPAAPGVPVYYHNHPVDTPLILSCPGAKPQHAVAWDQRL
ncbi:unnamed protein product [Coregonus sp. 'balchen']|nr:unnamed protein product [Coregonus sp. 'balchen']